MGQQNQQMRRARLVASVAATIISLACGTNYVYSAWAPQFAEKLKLSATQSNLIGQFGNLGMYSLGVPVGMLVDRRGPRPFVLVGAFLLVAGYFPLHMAYDRASGSVTALCFFSFLTGLGSCMAFAAAVKTSALNWPGHRGTATAFPLAAFGLSAFFFSFLGSVLFPGDPSAFLKLLSFGTVGLTFIGFFFLKVYPHSNHRVICHEEGRRSSSSSAHLRPPRGIRHSEEPGTSDTDSTNTNLASSPMLAGPIPPSNNPSSSSKPVNNDIEEDAVDETSSLMSSATPELVENVVTSSVDTDRSHRIDIRGFNLLRNQSFWLLFTIMAILSGVGLMTIK
ncbi:MFS transporter, putative [Metarhizium acridum CQMa 102]|uniref:MFS transporter, putative n=1 Tax=Metarhizium acridum (strain CQMa 102) TaxID=655827 RepID=E9EDE8_METAQ|nr:MFS transporter, putative [Metarhizium acridum CQMa 102]EFY86088.1 MFS transporter, putative [Metarhizium acridum CQMa 102]